MSNYETISTPQDGVRAGQGPADYDDYRRGDGFVLFAGIMLVLVATLNCIYGIAAIDNANFFVNDAKYTFGDLNTWGWIVLCAGVIQLVAGVLIFSRSAFGRWVGILSASGNAVVQLLWIPSYPFASLAFFTLDILIIYGLVVYGGRRAEA